MRKQMHTPGTYARRKHVTHTHILSNIHRTDGKTIYGGGFVHANSRLNCLLIGVLLVTMIVCVCVTSIYCREDKRACASTNANCAYDRCIQILHIIRKYENAHARILNRNQTQTFRTNPHNVKQKPSCHNIDMLRKRRSLLRFFGFCYVIRVCIPFRAIAVGANVGKPPPRIQPGMRNANACARKSTQCHPG